LYAATKKANELMAHTYSHLYNLPTTGLRFFTVYGPYDRPDMALQKFTKSIIAGEIIKVFNYGKHLRDFTYIDDIIEAITRVLDSPSKPNPLWNGANPDPSSSNAPWRIYNVGNNSPIKLSKYIETIELTLGVKAIKEFLPLQPGDVEDTFADVDNLVSDFDFKPATKIDEGINKFILWYKDYYSD
jgi:UDP-glucuronate 4-epimerase